MPYDQTRCPFCGYPEPKLPYTHADGTSYQRVLCCPNCGRAWVEEHRPFQYRELLDPSEVMNPRTLGPAVAIEP